VSQSDGPRRWLQASDEAPAVGYDVALVDLDGVVYLGNEPIDRASEALDKARALGMRLAFVTNNASRAPAEVAHHLVDLGVDATADDVVTSAQAAVRVIAERCGAGARVLVTGSPALRAAAEQAGLHPVDSPDEKPDAVVQGFWADLGYRDLADATVAVRAGALWVATNVDSTLPSPRGLLPGNGALIGVVATATGERPVVAGKPALPLHAEGVRRTSARHPLVVGDRLDTDIEGANGANTDSLLVLTGVTTVASLLAAPPDHRPTYLSIDLMGLVEPHPEVKVETNVSYCGGWRVTRPEASNATEPRVELDGDGPPVDGLRALVALAWATDDAGEELAGTAELVHRLCR
jgi:HAD superfamily hydrolase (TIGR01450 family)